MSETQIAFFDTKPYDRIWFEPLSREHGCHIKFFEYKLNADTAVLADGCEVACAFVNDTIDAQSIDALCARGVGLLALRCAGYNNVDFKYAFGKLHVTRVPSYSPAAVAEHACALMLTVNRKTHRAYLRTRDNNFNINGLMGMDLRGKTAGVVGAGKIGMLFINICQGLGMEVLAYDPHPAGEGGIRYVALEELFSKSDIISLHCPLTDATRHIVSQGALSLMKPHAILVNTSRGGLVDTGALIEALKAKKLGGAGLDVYEEESEYFFEDLSNEIVENDELSRLLSFPNVVVTSHQGFFTIEAMQAIAEVTMENIRAFICGGTLVNEVCYQCPDAGACVKKTGAKRCF